MQRAESTRSPEPPQELVDRARAHAIRTMEAHVSEDIDTGQETIDTTMAAEVIADDVLGIAWAALDLGLIRRACADPGWFVERERTDDLPSGYETLTSWQARAVVKALSLGPEGVE